MTEGEPYFIEGTAMFEKRCTNMNRNTWICASWDESADHFTVALEIEATPEKNTTGHHHSTREVQYIGLKTVSFFETTRIRITNPDSGKFMLIF